MISKKFCIIGVDNDFTDFIMRNYSFFTGYFSKSNRYYKFSKKKKLGDHNLYNWKKLKKKYDPNVIITIDDGEERENLFNKIYKSNCKNHFFKNSYVSNITKKKLLKRNGIIVQDFAKIMSNVNIGNGAKINIGSHIHHDCKIGKFVTIAPKAVLLGNVKVGNYSYIGANCTIKQKIKIGRNAIIGAGSVVVKDVKNFDIVAGVPAKSIKI